MTQPKLRVGLLLDDGSVPAWVFSAVERLAKSGSCEILLIVLNRNYGLNQMVPRRRWQTRNSVVFNLFNRIDEKLCRRQPNPLEPKNLLSLLPNATRITVNPICNGHKNAFAAADIERVKNHQPDILVKFGFGDLYGDVLTAARFGVWAYGPGNFNAKSGFWDVVNKQPETRITLRILGSIPQQDITIFGSSFSTHPFSPAQNRHTAFWAASVFLLRQIERLQKGGAERFFSDAAQFSCKAGNVAPPPKNLQALQIAGRLFGRVILRCCQKVFLLDQWYLRTNGASSPQQSLLNFQDIIPPKDRFWADPIAVQQGDSQYVFIEEYLYRTKKGHISVIKLDGQMHIWNPVRVLEKPYHLSYPFVFKWQGQWYMVPESAANRTISLYECTEFPYCWQFKMNLMENVRAVDTTVFFHNHTWWLFTGIAANDAAFPQVELFLYFSRTLFTGNWTPHPQNPIVSDIKRARPAGRLFEKHGQIYRPSQDCSKMYGYGFDLNTVLRLSETEYREKCAFSVRPHWDNKVQATHTFSQNGQLTVIDAFMRRPRFF